MEKTSEKQMIELSEIEEKKFVDKVMKSWSKYISDFKRWRLRINEVRKNYDGFGYKLPNMSVESEDLFKHFVSLEIKKSKNKRYNQFIKELSEINAPFDF